MKRQFGDLEGWKAPASAAARRSSLPRSRPPKAPLSWRMEAFGWPPRLRMGKLGKLGRSFWLMDPWEDDDMVPTGFIAKQLLGGICPHPELPCGLRQDEAIDMMCRELTPEDFEMLSKLDEKVPKTDIVKQHCIDGLPRVPIGECAEADCGVCLGELRAPGPEAATNAAAFAAGAGSAACDMGMAVQLPCRHAYHPACIAKWLTTCKNTCPLCSASLGDVAASAASLAHA